MITQGFDLPILLGLQNSIRFEPLVSIMKGISFFGDKGWFWLVLIMFFFIFKKTRGMSIVSAISFGVCAGVNSGIIKRVVQRIRPFNYTNAVIPLGERPDSFSFPSGHTVLAFAVAFILLREDKRIGIPAVIFASLIGFSRIYMGHHYPTDVIGAVLLALALSSVVWAITSIIRKRTDRKNRRRAMA